MSDIFSIGQLADLAATKVETVRYYERIGLLPQPPRTRGNYRSYARSHLERLTFIRRSRELGFSIDAVRELLRLSDDAGQSCAEVDQIADAKLAEIEEKIADLTALGAELRHLLDRCSHTTVANCRILGALGPRLSTDTRGVTDAR